MQPEEKVTFEIGDQVEWCGARGLISSIKPDNPKPIGITFDRYEVEMWFYGGGRLESWHPESSLKLISKAKKKRKVKLYAFLIRDDLTSGVALYSLRFREIEIEHKAWIRIPELDKEVEVEE